MIRTKVALLACFLAANAAAQAPTQQMADLSVKVVGAIPKDNQLQPVSVGGGFLIDSKHVVTTDGCCGKTKEGVDKTPVVIQGKNGSVAQSVWSGPGGLVILELKNPMQAPAATLAPMKLASQNQSAFTVVFPKDGAPTVSEAKIQGSFKPDGMDVQVFKAAPPPDDLLTGGAMFNACGQVMGINVLADKGIEFAIVADALAPGVQQAGAQVQVADQPCGGAQSASNAPPPPPASDKGGDKGKQPPPDKGPDKGGDKSGDKGGDGGITWRLPQGDEWIGVAIIGGLLGLALRRNTRQQVARALTTRRSSVPQVAYPPTPFPVAVRPTRPVLKGIAGQYAGASIALDTGPSLLGRDQSAANLVFSAEADSISKRHCVVRWDAARGVFTLEDLGSTNGTFLASGERLAANQPRDLRPGDRFYIGDLRNQFELRMEE